MSTVHTHPAVHTRHQKAAAYLKEKIRKDKINAIEAIGIASAKLEAAIGDPDHPLVTNMQSMLDRTVLLLNKLDTDPVEDAAMLACMRDLLELAWKLMKLGSMLETAKTYSDMSFRSERTVC